MNTIWPKIFEEINLISTQDSRAVCADGLLAWALCMSGNKPPENFGIVLVEVMKRLDMKVAATADNLSAHAKEKGWI